MLAPVCFASRVHSTSIGKFFPRNHLSDRYFMASSELNLLNTILLEDEADNK
jgi:hypothetical protein